MRSAWYSLSKSLLSAEWLHLLRLLISSALGDIDKFCYIV
jgi:hypothetical protein